MLLGNLYIADCYNDRIRKILSATPTAIPSMSPINIDDADIITTIAGTGTSSFSGDNGAATSATLSYPVGVALDSAGIL